ncbi:MAG: delta-60 repeat domain-containing protein [Acidobacteriota bacterium]|nr:delta-60 repeat domain-containing protein [Acidobacteriota bacterium]
MNDYSIHIKFLLFAIFCFGTGAEILAANGDLDLTFDGDGIVITDNNAASFENIVDLAVQPDGKIIAVGVSFSSMGSTVVVRYNLDGSLDSTFGNAGKTFIQSANPRSLALQSDGKIVIAGSQVVGTTGESPLNDFFVGRLNPNGSLDTTFNGTGTLVLSVRAGNNDDVARSVKIQPDGKIVLGGTSTPDFTFISPEYAIVRLNPTGTLDTSFDGDGKVFTRFPGNHNNVLFGALAIQTDGKIVATGSGYFLPGGNL